MLLLEKNDYHKVKKLLDEVTFNHLFARAVVEKKINGSIYVDQLTDPKTVYISHPYGMSLLAGVTSNNDFNSSLVEYISNKNKNRSKPEWLQVFPDNWNAKLSEILGDVKLETNTRVNFKFNSARYIDFKKKLKIDSEIVRTDKTIFEKMTGSVIPRFFWSDSNQFYTSGIGFSLLFDKIAVSNAFSAFVFDQQLEIGIETMKEYTGKGFALQSCSAIIDYCMDKNLEPIWACRLENKASLNLAQKLGFEPVLYIPFYKLEY